MLIIGSCTAEVGAGHPARYGRRTMATDEPVPPLDLNHEAAVRARVERIPIVSTLNLRLETFETGFCRAVMPWDGRYLGIFESLHGGLMMTLADTIACFAILTRTEPDAFMTTTDMNIRFLAPCLTDLTAEARVIKFGRSLCPVGVDLLDARGRRCAIAQVTYMRLDRAPGHGSASASASASTSGASGSNAGGGSS